MINYQQNFRGRLKMAVSYFTSAIESLECESGNHVYSEWSSVSSGNVAETEKQGENSYLFRDCRKCGEEMPESRIYKNGKREANSKTYNEVYKNCKECHSIIEIPDHQ